MQQAAFRTMLDVAETLISAGLGPVTQSKYQQAMQRFGETLTCAPPNREDPG
jgi:hypothetical protein